MKLNLMPLLVSLATTALTIHPVSAKVDVNVNTHAFPALKGIQLTPTQQVQILQIRSNAIARVRDILTSAQQETLRASLTDNSDIRTAIAGINLSNAQKARIRPILRSAYQQVTNVLTPPQQQQMQQNVRALFMGRWRLLSQ